MCTRNTIPDCRYDDGHVGSCEPWPAWAAELREENARLREALERIEEYRGSPWTQLLASNALRPAPVTEKEGT